MKDSDQIARSMGDGLVAGGLISAPAWAPQVSELNEILTLVTLLIGVALGVARLWRMFKPPK